MRAGSVTHSVSFRSVCGRQSEPWWVSLSCFDVILLLVYVSGRVVELRNWDWCLTWWENLLINWLKKLRPFKFLFEDPKSRKDIERVYISYDILIGNRDSESVSEVYFHTIWSTWRVWTWTKHECLCTSLWLHHAACATRIPTHSVLTPGCPALYTTTHTLFHFLLSTSRTVRRCKELFVVRNFYYRSSTTPPISSNSDRMTPQFPHTVPRPWPTSKP
jgi:hypothetical protein